MTHKLVHRRWTTQLTSVVIIIIILISLLLVAVESDAGRGTVRDVSYSVRILLNNVQATTDGQWTSPLSGNRASENGETETPMRRWRSVTR